MSQKGTKKEKLDSVSSLLEKTRMRTFASSCFSKKLAKIMQIRKNKRVVFGHAYHNFC